MEQLLEASPATVKAAPRLDLLIPPPKMLTAKEELEIARKAVARNGHSPALLRRLASMLATLDHFDEAIALLESAETAAQSSNADESLRLNILYTAYIGLQTQVGNLHARRVAETALDIAQTPEQRAEALANLAKTYTRFSEFETSTKLLEQAIEQNPANKDVYKRLSRLYLHEDPEKALRFAQDMIARGVLHARVLGSVPLSLAMLGRYEEAHRAEALDEFLLRTVPEPPPGWDSLAAFNDALSREVLSHPGLRYERYGTASAKSWRVDEPSLHRSAVFPQLQQLIRREVLRYVESLPTDGHPLVRACPARASLHNWCVVTQGEGHETWHVHQNGWMSGVYYIQVQDHIVNGAGPEGCLAFGISEEIVGDSVAAAYGERLVRPYAGLMMLFPSHSFHKTYPHHGEGHRICFAFDIGPVS